jgi:hypothetical protein
MMQVCACISNAVTSDGYIALLRVVVLSTVCHASQLSASAVSSALLDTSACERGYSCTPACINTLICKRLYESRRVQ